MVLNLSTVDVKQGKKVRESLRVLECGSAVSVSHVLQITRNTHFKHKKNLSHTKQEPSWPFVLAERISLIKSDKESSP